MAKHTRAQAAADSVRHATTLVILATEFAASSEEKLQEFRDWVGTGIDETPGTAQEAEGARQLMRSLTPDALMGAAAALHLFVQGITDAAGLVSDGTLDIMLQRAQPGLS